MYDPEFNLWMAARLEELHAATGRIREVVGEGHPLTKLCECFDDAIELLEQMRNDHDSCFDPAERKVLGKEIGKFVNALSEMWKQVQEELDKP